MNEPTGGEYKDIHFPKAGLDVSRAFDKQPNRHVGPAKDDYARTTPIGVNVRGWEAMTKRNRGGSRPGLSKYIRSAVVLDWILQDLNVIVISDSTAEA